MTKKKIKSATFPVVRIFIKFSILLFILIGVVYYIDIKGYFNPDEKNNHTKKKWDSFYDFTEKNNVDILLIGNSHLYSGINPKNLSATLGCNAFILASPGTHIIDSYFALKEALTKTYPKLVIIETYGIGNAIPHELKKQALSDQFKSFYARKHIGIKLLSTPVLFASDNYLYAWSNTIRNHYFIFKDTVQLNKNIKKIKQKSPKKNKKLYLGRFVRFQTGIEQDVMKRYDTEGAPVKGNEYQYSNIVKDYVNKIVKLCQEKEVELLFLTLPMYYKHVENYNIWKNRLGEILNQYPNEWLDMQQPYDTTMFSSICFENTYKKNQHMTYNGSLIATYKLAHFILDSLNIQLPNRSQDSKWITLFYGEEGFFENNSPVKSDKTNLKIAENLNIQNTILNEVLVVNNNNNTKTIIAKIKYNKIRLRNCFLKLIVEFEQNKKQQYAYIDIPYDIFHESVKYNVFKQTIKPIKIKKIVSGALVCNP